MQYSSNFFMLTIFLCIETYLIKNRKIALKLRQVLCAQVATFVHNIAIDKFVCNNAIEIYCMSGWIRFIRHILYAPLQEL